MTTKIVTWNVNSVRARLSHVIQFLADTNPDILLLQETKCQNDVFPYESFEDLGYNIAVHGQKTFNGVALLSKMALEDVVCGLPTFPEDAQARYIEGVTTTREGHVIRIASVYVPNGQSLDSDQYLYKMTFLERLRTHLESILTYGEAIIVGGDYNIAPTNEDVYDPILWQNRVLCSPLERKKLQSLIYAGYHDALAVGQDTPPGTFTWWDYRASAWEKDHGLRIDHLLISSHALDCLAGTGVYGAVRGQPKASDHAPVWCDLKGL